MTQEQYIIAKNMYLNKKSIRKISKELNINRKSLSKKLKEDNVEIIKGISKENLLLAYNEIKSGKTLTYVASKYNVDRHTLSKQLFDNNLRIPQKYSRSKDFDSRILELYNKNNSIENISKKLIISTNKVWLCLRENNIKINTYRKHNFNENIFEVIDTEEKAYWLGFLYADGYVGETGLELTLSSKDKEHLEKFKSFMCIEKDLEFRKATSAYRLQVHSVKLSQDLSKLGCYQNKSLTLKFPTEAQVPKYLIHHFMRGYFDGDGCIYHAKSQYKCQRVFSVIGTKEFLNDYDGILLKLGINNTKYNSEGNAFSVKHGGNIQVQKIYDFLYNNATIYLERKYYKFKLPS